MVLKEVNDAAKGIVNGIITVVASYLYVILAIIALVIIIVASSLVLGVIGAGVDLIYTVLENGLAIVA